MERAYREISNSRYRERFNIACSCLTRQSHDYPHGTWGVKGKLSVSLALPRRRRFSHVMLYFASGMARSQCRFTRFPVPSSFPLLSHSFSPIHTLFSPLIRPPSGSLPSKKTTTRGLVIFVLSLSHSSRTSASNNLQWTMLSPFSPRLPFTLLYYRVHKITCICMRETEKNEN